MSKSPEPGNLQYESQFEAVTPFSTLVTPKKITWSLCKRLGTESGLDYLICAEFARQRTAVDNLEQPLYLDAKTPWIVIHCYLS